MLASEHAKSIAEMTDTELQAESDRLHSIRWEIENEIEKRKEPKVKFVIIDGKKTWFKRHPYTERFLNRTGVIYGKLTALGHAGDCCWWCQCECGNIVDVPGNYLGSGSKTSCGCVPHINPNPERHVYQGAKSRCNNPKSPAYKNYGGRGIKFNFESFEEFFAELGERPTPKHQLDRIDNDGNYEAGNVRWATRQANMRNRRSNRILTIGDESLSVAEWSERYGIPSNYISNRLCRDWCSTCAVTIRPKEGKCTHRLSTKPTD